MDLDQFPSSEPASSHPNGYLFPSKINLSTSLSTQVELRVVTGRKHPLIVSERLCVKQEWLLKMADE